MYVVAFIYKLLNLHSQTAVCETFGAFCNMNWFTKQIFFCCRKLSVAKQMFPSVLPIIWTCCNSQKPCCQICKFFTRSGDFPDTVDDLNCQEWLTTNLTPFSGRRALTLLYFRDKLMWKHASISGPSASSGCCHNPQLLKHSGGQSHWVAAQRTRSLSHNTLGLRNESSVHKPAT